MHEVSVTECRESNCNERDWSSVVNSDVLSRPQRHYCPTTGQFIQDMVLFKESGPNCNSPKETQ